VPPPLSVGRDISASVTSVPTPPATALGLDIGGTSTRPVVLEPSGRRLGYGTAGGGNLSSHDRGAALTAVFAAIEAALAGIDPESVRYGLIGSAGSGHLADPEVAADIAARWAKVGLTCPYEVQSDAVVAFAAGTEQPDGTLILSGTGALVSAFVDRAMSMTVDGHGWLVGDRGSAFWLGREAAMHTFYALDTAQEPSALVQGVLDHYGVALTPDAAPRSIQAALERVIYREAPVSLAALAPLVTSLADEDPAARQIIDDAADHLLHAASAVRPAHDERPVVLAGSLLTSPTPLAEAVRHRLGRSWPSAPISQALEGAAAAAWLAMVRHAMVSGDEAVRAHATAVG